jgi:tRNA nucleotidyltransferase/poly(A) polymerase
MDKNILEILKSVDKAGYEVAIVGGGVRDFLSGKATNDWDLTTNARPEEILKLFPNAFYNNRFGTVGIPLAKDKGRRTKDGSKDVDDVEVVEITTYRTEKSYSDSRHPDEIVWGDSLEEDLERRDFTINSLALRFKNGVLDKAPVDLFDGHQDLKNKIIRAVGKADERFQEDALRMLRAIRFATTLEFEIEPDTKKAIVANAQLITKISGERIRDEVFKIVGAGASNSGFLLMRELGLLKYFLPEVDVCFGVEQKSPKRHHIYDVGTHLVMSMKTCPSSDPIVKFAALLHDIGKAKVAAVTEEGVRTFYNHEVVGAHQALVIADRFHLSAADKERVFRLVRWHQFSVTEEQTDKAVRRFIKNVGLENVGAMMDLRSGDRLGGGLEEAEGWRLKLFKKRIEDVLKTPFSVSDLKINGRDVMEALKIKPGPKVGEILNKLFEEVEEDYKKNEREYLLDRVKEL